MDTPSLFTPIRLGALTLPSRVIMAPMTRNRAEPGERASALSIEYYRQRATAGLIITEGSQIARSGQGPMRTPGIFNPEQITAWRRVTDAVHEAGGRIALQLWHTGRAGHSDISGQIPVSASPIAIKGTAYTPTGLKPYETPRPLAVDELPGIVALYAQGARNAMTAGFDGVEIHGANGYLIDQFLRDSSNHRTDGYGGSIENRVRFMREVTVGVVDAIGADRVGIRLSPHNPYQDMYDSNPDALFLHAARTLAPFGLAWLHVLDPLGDTTREPAQSREGWLTGRMKQAFGGPVIANGGFTGALANEVIAAGDADAVAFGVPFLANPDLPARLLGGAALNAPDPATFYTGEEKGYVDYPALTAAVA
jgi:N-ethylmaleimide reductase